VILRVPGTELEFPNSVVHNFSVKTFLFSKRNSDLPNFIRNSKTYKHKGISSGSIGLSFSSETGFSGRSSIDKMGPTKETEQVPPKATESRPRRGSLPELKSAEKSAAEKKVPTGPRANPLYKTRLCMNFQSTGSCPYTEKCQFAHGVKELEKWENWRNSHKSDETKKDGEESDDGSRSRSQSLDKTLRTHSSDESVDIGSPHSLNWDINTPVKGSSTLTDENMPLSASSNFSLWSLGLEDLENDRPFRCTNRTRAATYDCTYDNMSQLRDAPTLFPSPPILPNFGRMNPTH